MTATARTLIPARDITAGDTIRYEGAPTGTELDVITVAVSGRSGNVEVTAITRALGHTTRVRRYLTGDTMVVLVAALRRPLWQPTPALDLDALQAVTAAAVETAEQVECPDCYAGSCQAALTSANQCECACRGKGHGTDRTGLIPARSPQPAQAVRTVRATAAAFAAAAADDEDLAPRRVAAVTVYLDDDERPFDGDHEAAELVRRQARWAR